MVAKLPDMWLIFSQYNGKEWQDITTQIRPYNATFMLRCGIRHAFMGRLPGVRRYSRNARFI